MSLYSSGGIRFMRGGTAEWSDGRGSHVEAGRSLVVCVNTASARVRQMLSNNEKRHPRWMAFRWSVLP